MSTSVRKIVDATGNDTAIKFFIIPRPIQLYPFFSRYNDRHVSMNPKFVLNISFLITSSGFVNAAPAIPATDDFTADLISSSRFLLVLVGSIGGSIRDM